MIIDAPWYVPNAVYRNKLPDTFKEEIRRYSSRYSAPLSVHPNDLVVTLMAHRTTGDYENACQIICLPDSKCTCLSCSSSIYGLICKSHSHKLQKA
jgi:hypothetical protein